MASIIVYTTPGCGYCRSAKRLLAQRGLAFEEIDVARDPGLRAQISRENGNYRTVPMIFVAGRFIGGYDQLAALDEDGELAALLPKI
jgi:glutaredoxin 3